MPEAKTEMEYYCIVLEGERIMDASMIFFLVLIIGLIIVPVWILLWKIPLEKKKEAE